MSAIFIFGPLVAAQQADTKTSYLIYTRENLVWVVPSSASFIVPSPAKSKIWWVHRSSTIVSCNPFQSVYRSTEEWSPCHPLDCNKFLPQPPRSLQGFAYKLLTPSVQEIDWELYLVGGQVSLSPNWWSPGDWSSATDPLFHQRWELHDWMNFLSDENENWFIICCLCIILSTDLSLNAEMDHCDLLNSYTVYLPLFVATFINISAISHADGEEEIHSEIRMDLVTKAINNNTALKLSCAKSTDPGR